MIPVIVCRIDVSEILSTKNGPRKFRGGMTNAHRAMSVEHAKFLPRHTAPGAVTRYGFIKRKPGYVKRARAINPNWRPLRLSGELEKSLKNNVKPTGTYLRGKLVIKAILGTQTQILPSGKSARIGVSDRFRFKAGQMSLSQQQEQMVMRKAEITATTRDEVEQIANAGGRAFTAYVKTGAKIQLK